ncbi:MAG: formyltransferase [Gammaproteobacteria bacterium]
MPRAVVFAYHDVGDRCLRALISGGWDVPLVVTHRADPAEEQWFADVATTASEYGIPVLTPESAEVAGVERTLAQLRPDFIFSFYFRWMLDDAVLSRARRGALNMHGSLLPKYRGRAPVNWAIVNGERESGATLHYMTARADAGDIVDQLAVPVLADDTACDVMRKVACAAETVLVRTLPRLANGDAPRVVQDSAAGNYCGRRTPEDGRIDWSWPAQRIHNLVRAVAPPYPGAFGEVGGKRWDIHRTLLVKARSEADRRPRLFEENGSCYLGCGDGGVLRLMQAATDGRPVNLEALAHRLVGRPLYL